MAPIELSPAYYPNDVCTCATPCDAYGGCIFIPGTGHDETSPCCCAALPDCTMYGQPCPCNVCTIGPAPEES